MINSKNIGPWSWITKIMTLFIKSRRCNLTLKNISSPSKIRFSTSLINKILLMRVKNNYMKLLKKILMSLIKNIQSLKDMRILKDLYQSKMSLNLMINKSKKKPKKFWMKIIKRREKMITKGKTNKSNLIIKKLEWWL